MSGAFFPNEPELSNKAYILQIHHMDPDISSNAAVQTSILFYTKTEATCWPWDHKFKALLSF
jgi:hypothetical protein